MSEGNGAIGIPSSEALSSMVSTLMSNPELMKSIAGIVGNMGSGAIKNEDTAPAAAEPDSDDDENTSERVSTAQNQPPGISPELMSKLPVLLSLLGDGANAPKSKNEAEREALLCALKPYLSPKRADAIEKLIRISRLGDMLTSL